MVYYKTADISNYILSYITTICNYFIKFITLQMEERANAVSTMPKKTICTVCLRWLEQSGYLLLFA